VKYTDRQLSTSNQIDPLQVLGRSIINTGVLCIVFSLFSFGVLFDQKWYAAHLETVRVTLFLMIDLWTTSTGQPTDNLFGLPALGLQILRLWLMFSLALWMLLTTKQSMNGQKKKII
jgi:hypothetical protein